MSLGDGGRVCDSLGVDNRRLMGLGDEVCHVVRLGHLHIV